MFEFKFKLLFKNIHENQLLSFFFYTTFFSYVVLQLHYTFSKFYFIRIYPVQAKTYFGKLSPLETQIIKIKIVSVNFNTSLYIAYISHHTF